VIILGIVVTIPSFVASKKIKKGKQQIPVKEFEIKHLKDEIKQLINKKRQVEKAAQTSIKFGNYTKAAELYEECKNLSNQLFKKGIVTEAENTKYYANMKSKAFQAREQMVSSVTYSINELLTKYCDSILKKYYSYPHIHSNGQNVINGWILNDTNFLQHRLTNPKNGSELIRELGIDPENLSHITAIHFVYTSDLSFKSIIDICQEHQNPNIIIFIVGISWPSRFQDRHSFTPPEEKTITYRENIRIINKSLFADLIGLEGKYRDSYFKIFKSLNKSIPQ
jgi:polyhydroxyalkanoate synthesis regulator phasin